MSPKMVARDAASPAAGPGLEIRRLLRSAAQATLATISAGQTRASAGEPHASLVLLAVDHQGAPLLLLSDLAVHSRHLAADPRLSLLVQGPGAFDDPLEGPRVSLQGRAVACAPDEEAGLLARFVARFPAASLYAGFEDFRLYRVIPSRGHLVAGFGRIHWVEAKNFLLDAPADRELEKAEPAILAEVNDRHGAALNLMAAAFLGDGAADRSAPWRQIGFDPEGLDLRSGRRVRRLNFDAPDFASLQLPLPVADADGARQLLAALTRAARKRVSGGRGAGSNCDIPPQPC